MNKRILCLLLCLSLALSCPLAALAQQSGGQISIRSLDDFLAFAENCILDSYSRDVTVWLKCDLDLSDTDFAGIPTFGGIFEGQNHVISGLNISADSSAAGLFRYIQPGAIVRDLTVSGQVRPGGTAAMVGGIAGSNRGLIRDCRFEGSVAGKQHVGGIAGENAEGGSILRSASRGVVVGENMTGGITGYNLGLVDGCENHACVNIDTPDSTLDLSEIDLSVLMDPASLTAGITIMDTGGIAGYSIGAIYNCVNAASVGYPHIGYNVGGIAGRSSGILSGCTNEAPVQGRKDVGGIVGQMEPNVSLNLSEDHLQLLQTQLEELETLGRQLQGSFDRLGAANTHLNNTLTHIDDASGALENLAGYAGDYGNALTAEVNRASLLLQDALRQLLPVLEQATVLGEKLEQTTHTLSMAMSVLGDAAADLRQSIALLNDAAEDLQTAGSLTTQALEQLTQGVEALLSGLQSGDPEQTSMALDKIENGLSRFAAAATQAEAAAQKLADALQQGAWNDEAGAALTEAVQALQTMTAALSSMAEGLSGLADSMEFDADSFWSAMEKLHDAMGPIGGAMGSLQAAAEDLSLSLDQLEQAAGQGAEAIHLLSWAMSEMAGCMREMTLLGQLLHTAVANISHYQPIQLPYLDSGAADAADALFDSINAVSDELRAIVSISDRFSQEAKQQLNAIYEQFTQILDTAAKLAGQVLDTTTEGIIKDTSHVDIDAVKAGKVSLCCNRAVVSGDINAGGIVGAMAIEYQLDPEDDLSSKLSQYRLRTYQAKAIVQNCTNLGQIEGKRSYMGGICGKMDMGIILSSDSFAQVSSSEGDYVGGIAGSAAGPIQGCSVKAAISGGKYVGGVAGLADAVSDCRSMTLLQGSERVGAVLGYAESVSRDAICGNLYFALPGSPGAIDGISYEGCAQASAEDAFLAQNGLDSCFAQAVLTFCFADGSVRTLSLPVSTVLESSMIPALENADGQIVFWNGLEEQLGQPQYFDRILTAQHKAMISVVESAETRPDGKPVLLLQGSFLKAEKLPLQRLTDRADALEGWQFVVPEGGTVTQVRYDCPAGEENVQILALGRDGDYQAVSYTRSGSYLVFGLEDSVTAFYVLPGAQENSLRLWIIVAAVAAVTAAVAIVLVRKKSKPASRRGNKK